MNVPTMRERADRAHEAVRAYMEAMPGDGFHLADLIGDLGHWKDVYGVEFDHGQATFRQAVEAALQHYEEETADDDVDPDLESIAEEQEFRDD